ncbi:flagellar motor switch protein FliG [bacterium MnTg02]|nr:flagellar motor switch protein FliG [bacterium MnTg02]
MAAAAERKETEETKKVSRAKSVASPADKFTGAERAAIFLLALGQEHGLPIWQKLDDEELAEITIAMSRLGQVATETVEYLVGSFISQMSLSGALVGTFESTERLLLEFLPSERVTSILEEVRGPAGRNMWEKLSNVQANVLANYLKNEYPQTVAVILSKIAPDHAANVLGNLQEEFALEVVRRMLGMDSVQRDVLEKIEQTLRSEFISNLAQTRQRDAHELMAEIFNNFDRQTESRFLSSLEEADREAADRIRTLMFTFEDLTKLDTSSTQTLLRHIEKDVLTLAMKGAPDLVRDFFFSNMSERAGKMLRDDLEAMGPVRLRDVDEAQTKMIAQAKDLAAKGEIIIAVDGGNGDEIIY